ncbi:MAG TPA: RING finger protein [Armatimonadota bacterium]|nr:RING finger protein [Armatimonadota bacterium]
MYNQGSSGAGSAENKCPVCNAPIQPGTPVKQCDACGVVHHAACWSKNGGCGTFRCTGVKQAPTQGMQPQAGPAQPRPQAACAKCGYVLGPLDSSCPRCAKGVPVSSAGPAQPGYGPGQQYGPQPYGQQYGPKPYGQQQSPYGPPLKPPAVPSYGDFAGFWMRFVAY